jgi:hypothetical protein
MTPSAATQPASGKGAANAKDVRLFSDEYFDLAKKNTADENKVLASQRPGEELRIELRGQVYRIK